MISLQELLDRVKSSSKGNRRLVKEAEEMWYALNATAPEDRFFVIYNEVGPNIEVLGEVCELFDIHVHRFIIQFETEGLQYEVEVEDADYIPPNIETIERVEHIHDSLRRLLID